MRTGVALQGKYFVGSHLNFGRDKSLDCSSTSFVAAVFDHCLSCLVKSGKDSKLKCYSLKMS